MTNQSHWRTPDDNRPNVGDDVRVKFDDGDTGVLEVGTWGESDTLMVDDGSRGYLFDDLAAWHPIPDPTYGLTIRDPWAQATIWGSKRIENRDWRPPDKVVGERIAISTSKTVDDEADEEAARAPQDGTDIPWSEYHEWICEYADEHDVPATVGYRHHPGHIIGTVRVAGWVSPEGSPRMNPGAIHGEPWRGVFREWAKAEKPESWPERCAKVSDWFTGPVGWLLADPEPLDEPIPVRGMPGIWDVDEQVEAA